MLLGLAIYIAVVSKLANQWGADAPTDGRFAHYALGYSEKCTGLNVITDLTACAMESKTDTSVSEAPVILRKVLEALQKGGSQHS